MDPKLTLSYEDFERLAEGLVQRSRELGDGWELRETTSSRTTPAANQNNPLYLVRKSTLTHKRTDSRLPGEETASDLDELAGDTSKIAEDEDGDVASLDRSGGEGRGEEIVHMEYHVIHSPSYQVPTLYFNATYSNGQALSLEQVWDLLSANYVSQGADKWGVATQQEHPHLGRPFYHIHPCHTATVVGRAMQCCHGDDASGNNYLVTWLSTFAPVVGLEFSMKYAE